MPKKKIPFFRFYPSDFMDGVRGLSAQEVGLYTMLLCRMYEESGPIEDHPLRLSTYCGMREKTFAKTLEKLVALGKIKRRNGMLTNDRAEIEISDRSHDLENAIAAGKASAKKRQQKQSEEPTGVERSFNHTDRDTDIRETNVSLARQTRRRSSKTALPDDWVPDMAKAQSLMAELDLTRDEMNYCYQQMKGHAHATDRRLANWDQGFANWLRKAVKDGDVGPNSRSRRNSVNGSAFDF
jgi:uncharacterized protein YdaU (DUF1376 family)